MVGRRTAGLVLALAAFLASAGHGRAQDWRRDWEATIAGAKAEGALAIAAPAGREWREQLLAFGKSYPEIKLDITAFASRDFWPRYLKEREAGQYLWDLRIGGPESVTYALKNAGEMAPIRDLLLLPENKDDSLWLGGLDALFLDREHRYFPAFAAYTSDTAYYNTTLVTDPKLQTMTGLVDPALKGKISMADPRGGASIVTLGVLVKAYGSGFVEKLLGEQQPVITKEGRQQMDWLASGRYPVAFGLPSIAFVEYAQRGAKLDAFKEYTGLDLASPGVGGIQMPAKLPHPNAAKLFVNWLLSKEVQAPLMKAVKLNSRRRDVAPGAPERALDPAKLDRYLIGQAEDLQEQQKEAARLVRALVK